MIGRLVNGPGGYERTLESEVEKEADKFFPSHLGWDVREEVLYHVGGFVIGPGSQKHEYKAVYYPTKIREKKRKKREREAHVLQIGGLDKTIMITRLEGEDQRYFYQVSPNIDRLEGGDPYEGSIHVLSKVWKFWIHDKLDDWDFSKKRTNVQFYLGCVGYALQNARQALIRKVLP